MGMARMGMMMMAVAVMLMPVCVSSAQEDGAGDVHQQADGCDHGRRAEVDGGGAQQPQDGLDTDAERDHPQHQRRRKAGQVADFSRAETEPLAGGVALRKGLGSGGHRQRTRMRRHVKSVGKQRHRARGISGRNLADHHDRGEHDDPKGTPSIFIMRRPEEIVRVNQRGHVRGSRHRRAPISHSGG